MGSAIMAMGKREADDNEPSGGRRLPAQEMQAAILVEAQAARTVDRKFPTADFK